MANDIIKQIILKFKADDKALQQDVKQMAKDVGDQLSRLEKRTDVKKSVVELSKGWKEFEKSAQKTGMTLGKEFNKLKGIVKEIAVRDLDVMDKRLNRTIDNVERREKILEQRRSRGDVRGEERSKRRAARSLAIGADLGEERDKLAEAAGAGGRGGGGNFVKGIVDYLGPAGVAGLATGVAAAIAKSPAMLADWAQERNRVNLQNPAIASSEAIRQRMAMYQGDATMGVLARKGTMNRAQDYASKQSNLSKMRDYGTTAGGIGMMGLGAAAFMGGLGLNAAGAALDLTGIGIPLGLTAGIGGTTMMASGIGMMAGGAYATKGGGNQLIDRALGNKTEAEKARFRQEAIEAEKARLIDPKLYQSFRDTAVGRAQMQRELGISSEDAFKLRQTALSPGIMMDPEEQAAMMQQLKPIVGANQAGNMSNVIGTEAFNQGMSRGTAADLATGLALGGKGGTSATQKNMEELFTKAVAAGISDSGLRESLEKATVEMAKGSTTRMDTGRLMESLLNYVSGGKQPGQAIDPREAAAAAGAMQMREQEFAGISSLDTAVKQSSVRGFFNKRGAKLSYGQQRYVESLTREQIMQGTPELEDMGVKTQEDRNALLSKTEGALGYDVDEKRIFNQLKEYGKGGSKEGQKPPEELLRRYSMERVAARRGIAGFKDINEETRMAQAKGVLSTEIPGLDLGTAKQDLAKLSPYEQQQRAMDTIRAKDAQDKQSPELKQAQDIFGGKKKEDKDIRTNIGEHYNEISETQRQANKAVATAGNEANPALSAEAATEAMDRFANALDTLSKNINQKFGNATPGF